MAIRYALQWILAVWNLLLLFFSMWYVLKCFHRNKAANSKQSGGCKYELVSERHSARNNVENKGLVAICLLTYFVLLCFVTQ